MANWWDEAPLVEDSAGGLSMTEPKPEQGEDWWSSAPLATQEAAPKLSTDAPVYVDEFKDNPEDRPDDRGVPGGPTFNAGFVEDENRMAEPTVDMYSKIPKTGDYVKDAQAERQLYDAYGKDPERSGSTFLGEPTYDNVVVPNPAEADSAGNMSPIALTTNAARGLGKTLAVQGAAGLDELASKFGIQSDLTTKAQKAIADPAKGNGLDNFLTETMQVGAGMAAGYRMTGKGLQGETFNPKHMASTFARVMSSIGASIGGVAAMSPESGTALVGDNSAIGSVPYLGDALKGTMLDGVPVDKNGKPSEQVLAKKYNQLIDALTIAAAAEGIIRSTAWAGKTVKAITYDQLVPLWSKSAREAEAIDDVVSKLNVEKTDDIEELVRTIRSNMKSWISVADSNIDNVPIERTTMSSINEGYRGTDNFKADQAMSLEKGMSSDATVNLGRRIQQPLNEFDKFQTQAAEARGGMATVDDLRANLAGQGREQINDLRQGVGQARQALEGSEESTREMLRRHPLFGEEVKRFEAGPQLDVNKTKSSAEDRVMKNIEESASALKGEKNRLYDELAEGTPINEETLIDVLKSAEDYLPKRVLDVIADEGTILDFKTANTKILPAINEALRLAHKNGTDQNAIDALTAVKNNIKIDQSRAAMQMGSPEEVKKISEAESFYKDTYAPLRGSNTTKDAFDPMMNPYDKKNSLQKMSNALKDSEKGSSEAVLDLLTNPVSKGDPDDIVKVYTGKIAADFGRKIARADGIDAIDPDDIVSRLAEQGTIIKERFPKQAAQLEKLAGDLKASKGNVTRQKEILSEITKNAEASERKVLGSVLGKFVKKDPTGKLTDVQDGYQVMKSLFNKETSDTEIDEAIKLVKDSGDPAAQRGLESSYLNYLKDRIREGESGLNPKNARRFTNEEMKNLKGYGMKIFDNKDLVESYDTVVSTILRERDKRGGATHALESKGAVVDGARMASNFIINQTFGPLSRGGARARSLMASVLRTSDQMDDSFKILEAIHADPEYAMGLLKKLGVRKDTINQEAKDVLWKLTAWSGIYDPSERKKFEEDFKKASNPASAETDKLLREKK